MSQQTFLLLAAAVKILIVVGFALGLAGPLTLVERRQMAMMQDRIGPNRANLRIFGKNITAGGLFHPVADALKFFFKADFVPPNADKVLHGLAPILSMFPPICLLAIAPFADTLCPETLRHSFWAEVPRFGTCAMSGPKSLPPVPMMVADLNVGILFVFALAGMGIIGATIAGWSSDNKYSLLGGLRAASQLISYEVAMGLSIIGCLMTFGSLRLDDIARWQDANAWGIFVQPLGFLLFFTASLAEGKRTPFDQPEGESEIAAGYLVEYSGMKFGMFYTGEYIEMIVLSGLLVAFFLGGYNVPFLHRDGFTLAIGDEVLFHKGLPHIVVTLLQLGTFFVKTTVVTWAQVFIRWTLPRFRYDQLMKLGWRMLLPACLVNIFLTGVILLGIDRAGENVHTALKVAADLSNALMLFTMIALPLWAIYGLLTPSKHISFTVLPRPRKMLRDEAEA
ncbi:MAG: NADH-quinone oxidoreductase subunit H [Myxococcales bacterium]|nr:NADH-quinone oxidoreductase subunit H [Myxococcales bacterium]